MSPQENQCLVEITPLVLEKKMSNPPEFQNEFTKISKEFTRISCTEKNSHDFHFLAYYS